MLSTLATIYLFLKKLQQYSSIFTINTIIMHTIKPGTPEYGTTEHGPPRNSGGTTEHYPEHQQNTPEYQRNINVLPLEHSQNNETMQNEFKQIR